MENFNADAARKLSVYDSDGELNDILLKIKESASKSLRHLAMGNSIHSTTRKKLIQRGFEVLDVDSIAMQRDGVYLHITW